MSRGTTASGAVQKLVLGMAAFRSRSGWIWASKRLISVSGIRSEQKGSVGNVSGGAIDGIWSGYVEGRP